MNYRTILLATAAVMFAGAANAEDITAPMYLPGAGKVLSNTSLQYERTSLKHNAGAGEDFRASEEITYGVTDNFSVVAEIGNQFDFEGLTNQEYNNDHNFDYAIGAKYNMQHGNWLAQVGASYYTFDPKSWYGHRGNDGTRKSAPTSNWAMTCKTAGCLTPRLRPTAGSIMLTARWNIPGSTVSTRPAANIR